MDRPPTGRSARRVVVYGGGTALHLPPAAVEPGITLGGPQTMHELAFAIAATGRPVELRCNYSPSLFEALEQATGVAPDLPAEPRPPSSDDVLIFSEGQFDPLDVGRAVLSGARCIWLVLAPPGLFGWPLTAGWTPPSPLTVDREALARPETFRAAHALGLNVWTHMPRMREVVEASGVPCRLIGNGSPLGPPVAPRDKTVDVAWIRANRWAPLAERVVAEFGDELTVDGIERAPHDEVLRRLGRARILVFPSRIEGHSRLGTEARGLGCVPVALASNEFATGFEPRSGAVVVESVDDIAAAARELLAEPARLAQIADNGRRAVARQLDWDAYVARVDAGLTAAMAEPRPPAAEPLGEIGSRLAALLDAADDRGRRAEAELAAAVATLEAERVEFHAERARLHAAFADEIGAFVADRDRLARELGALQQRRAVRLALRAAELRRLAQ